MKPYVICHMAASVDGRILTSRWRPAGAGAGLFARLHDRLEKVTDEEYLAVSSQ
jgi:riboflavin biosynthesis pyrimidine reductase